MFRAWGTGRKVMRPARQLALPCTGPRGTQPPRSRAPPPNPRASRTRYATSWPRRRSPSRREIRHHHPDNIVLILSNDVSWIRPQDGTLWLAPESDGWGIEVAPLLR